MPPSKKDFQATLTRFSLALPSLPFSAFMMPGCIAISFLYANKLVGPTTSGLQGACVGGGFSTLSSGLDNPPCSYWLPLATTSLHSSPLFLLLK